jgi:hypothetical protein
MTSLIERLAERARDPERAKGGAEEAEFRFFPPATPEALRAEEEKIGFPLPGLLREIYTHVANGGFGPGYGLLGVEDGALSDEGDTAGTLYTAFRQIDPAEPAWRWPEKLLPICHWGCAIYSCLDCSKEAAPVIIFDPHCYDHEDETSMARAFIPHAPSFREWLEDWLAGVDLWERVYGSVEDADDADLGVDE